jgi:Holliday junction DNA helicase RuvB
MPKPCQEILYTAMEDFALDIVVGKGNAGKTIRLNLPKFTLIGATNKPNLCLAPLRDRFQLIFKLNYYKDEELRDIIVKVSKSWGLEIEKDLAFKLAKASKGIPRQALNLVRRLREFVLLNSKTKDQKLLKVSSQVFEDFLKLLDIDEWGLTPEDRRCLLTLYKEFKGGPVGVTALALSADITPEEFETIYEPALIRMGLIARTKRGRILTQKGYLYLKEKFNLPYKEGIECLFSS